MEHVGDMSQSCNLSKIEGGSYENRAGALSLEGFLSVYRDNMFVLKLVRLLGGRLNLSGC